MGVNSYYYISRNDSIAFAFKSTMFSPWITELQKLEGKQSKLSGRLAAGASPIPPSPKHCRRNVYSVFVACSLPSIVDNSAGWMFLV
jgi:hypothetical protein